MANFEKELECSCGVKAFGMLDLLKHRRTSCEHRICCICLETMSATILEPCLHNQFCLACIKKVMTTSNRCPCCRSGISFLHSAENSVTNHTLDKAAHLAIDNHTVLTLGQTKLVLNWQRYLATIRHEDSELQVLDACQVWVDRFWARVLQRAHELNGSIPMSIDLIEEEFYDEAFEVDGDEEEVADQVMSDEEVADDMDEEMYNEEEAALIDFNTVFGDSDEEDGFYQILFNV
jgi:Zinc finger, C3HC4 type (RING finger)